jgi:hypothetical protein
LGKPGCFYWFYLFASKDWQSIALLFDPLDDSSGSILHTTQTLSFSVAENQLYDFILFAVTKR